MRTTPQSFPPHAPAQQLARLAWSLVVAALGAAAGTALTVAILRAAGYGCERVTSGDVGPDGYEVICPDGLAYAVPGLAGGAAAGWLVLGVAALGYGWHGERDTRERMARVAMWLVVAVALIPGIGWPVLTLGGADEPSGLLGLAGLAIAAAPLVAARYARAAVPAVLGAWLAGTALVLMAWQRLILLVPFAAACLGGWLLALALWLWAGRTRPRGHTPD